VSRDAALSGFAEPAKFSFDAFETGNEIPFGNDLQIFSEVTVAAVSIFRA
jgi:hypothetical protein